MGQGVGWQNTRLESLTRLQYPPTKAQKWSHMATEEQILPVACFRNWCVSSDIRCPDVLHSDEHPRPAAVQTTGVIHRSRTKPSARNLSQAA